MNAALPRITYPPELPVSQRRDDIATAIRDNQVVILAGATGSGKTTQLPKICLELGRTSIAHTQPRRIAARTIAERVADELGVELGGLVGYQVRFTDQVSDETRIALMTDGILLNRIHRDRELRAYDTIIIDEAHERSLNIDFLLGYLKRLLPKRPDLKVIVTSATIDPERFAAHFDDAPIIEVSGRTYPVEIRYRPLVADRVPAAGVDVEADELDELDDEWTPDADRDVNEGIVAALDELAGEAPGDVLVFLPGEAEIRDAQDAIRAHLARSRRPGDTEVLPLFGRLSAAEQHRIFDTKRAPGVVRRVVLATNVAETSLTVPGIAYVIDTGTARISRYSTRAKVQRLPIEPVSQASANQRSGRSGRTRDGIAIRLYSAADFAKRPEYTDPEILRTNLASVLLQMLELGLGEIERFPFIQPPDPRGVRDGVDLLRELGAVDAGEGRAKNARLRLTRTGRSLARLPIDPRFARMVVESKLHDVSREVLVVVAGLTVQDIRERPLDRRARADQLHARFRDPSSDFLTLLNLWDYLDERQQALGSSAFRRLCRDEHLNFVRFREWQDVFRQLRQLAGPLGLRIDRPARTARGTDTATGDAWHAPEGHAAGDAIHRSVLAGLLSHLGVHDRVKRDYLGARGTRFSIFPGSGLAKSPPDAVMAAELVETSRLFARTVARIDPAWAEALAGPLAKRQHSEPHWERKRGQVVALENVTLYGVPVVKGRRVGFAAIDPRWSRDLFIRHALVEGDWTGDHAFERRNRQLRSRLTQIEERERRRDLVADDDVVFAFFDERIPDDVVSQPTFERWWSEAEQHTPELLDLRRADLLGEEAEQADDADAFPTQWRQGDQRLKLRYRFDPGASDDGVTAIVPLPLLARLDPVGFDWQVPGMRTELVTALLRSLPKVIRRNFVPAADWAAKLVDALGDVRPDRAEPVPGPLDDTLRHVAERQVGIRFDTAEFDWSKVPGHLRMRFRVVDERGRELAAGDDLAALQARLKEASERSLLRATSGERPRPGRRDAGPAAVAEASGAASAGHDFDRTALTEWPMDEIPAHIDIRQKQGVVRAYPTLRLGPKGRVDLALVTTADEQAALHPPAVAALVAAGIPSPVSYVQEHLTAQEKLSLASSPYASTSALLADVVRALAARAVAARGDAPVRTRAEFEAIRDALSASLIDELFAQTKVVAETLARHRAAGSAISRANHLSVLPSLADARGQLDALVSDGFVSRTGIDRLAHLPRYLRAVEMRMERMSQNASLERAGLQQITQALGLYEAAGGTLPLAPGAPANIAHARWLLEEFRVSLFAQQLGTAEPASLKRLKQALTA
ncbi:ATP-dependent RNA helicase HrpA [Pseudoclavibacter chungangensis]|uniref:ATP-dependent RNA helicase HrpA n=1 Tax=Pseudoclavibacter chungangensis TaxID=587635 RepID=A0A7J5BWR1_9MICO|nr:ATP-dependent RNA helicase HrpA [Pseudoclavibacter chungangensis]KAB1657991.1 ATP-dependent RNA helicase HrpA [Pseudoclavibacter chungangensis]NYJ65851.1 ATP-dependent helicase HrpA [Pseudoclavibacter chungangensis]